MRFIISLLAALATLGAMGAPPPPASGSIHLLDWLVGHTWRANSPDPNGKLAYINVRYDWATTGNFIQFSTRFVDRDGSVERSYAGNFYYDPSAGKLMMWYMNDSNQIVQGPVSAGESGMSMSFQAPGDEDKLEDYRVDVARTTPVAYGWSLFGERGGSWNKLLTLEYVRLDR